MAFHVIKKLSLLQALLAVLAATATAAAADQRTLLPQALPGCLDHCGNLTIPYPFGIGDGCYLRPEFNTICYGLNSAYFNTTAGARYMTHISLEGELQIIQEIAYDCYNDMNEPLFSNNPSLSLPTPYTISDTKNKFIVVGCDALALFQGHRGDENYTTGCMSICDDNVGSANASCSGIGHCGYALIVQEEEFTYSGNKSITDLLGIEQLPMVVNWGIGDEPCDAAEKKLDYACKKNNIDECEANPCNGLNGSTDLFDESVFSAPGCAAHPSISAVHLTLTFDFFKMDGGDGRVRGAPGKEKYFTENGGLLLQQKLTSQGGSVETTKLFAAEELEKATNNYHESRILGEGGYGTVYRGILLDNRVVAIKKSKVGAPTQTDQFVNEVIVLSQINHRNVVRLLGCCLETEVPLLVYEFITQGTLFEHIHKNKGKGSLLSWELRLKVASETAGALAYLHSSASTPIIHRDVKTMNILLDDNYTAKVSDFGASRFIPIDQTQLATLVQGTFGYLDPEYFHSNQLTEKSDVYSFGVVLAELLTSRVALSFARPEAERCLAHFFVCLVEDGNLNQILCDDIVNEEDIDQRVIENVAHLAKRCLRVKEEERPTMREVAMELEGMIMTKHPWGSADHNFPEETMHLLGSPNTFMDYIVNVDGDGGPGTTSGCDSMQLELLNSYADRR
ncbi:hypothetical protein ACLB2K_028285 [Fragaria x ananassa]